MDVRSLAAFRIGLAVLLLLDLADRAHDLRAHYTDWGVMPRGALLDLFLGRFCFSFHFINGTWQWQLFLFFLLVVFALVLLIGYRTRLVTMLCWMLLVSLQNRNPLVLQGGDTLLRMCFFWGIFLPLGACWSIDRHFESDKEDRQRMERTTVVSWATGAVLVQISLVYVFAGLLKTGTEWTEDNTAIYYAMSVDQLTTPVGRLLLEYPRLMTVLTYVTVKLELFGPLLFFVPFSKGLVRLAAIGLFFALQFGIAATLRIYLFPWICICASLPLLPPVFWDKLAHFWNRPRCARKQSRVTVAHRIRTLLTLHEVLRPPSSDVAATPRSLNLTVAFFLAYVVVWNLGTLPQSMTGRKIQVVVRHY